MCYKNGVKSRRISVMEGEEMGQEPENRDAWRTQATQKVWGSAIGMMGLCIPLTAILSFAGGSVMMLPLTVIVGAAFGTAAIWNPFRRPDTTTSSKQLEEQTQQIQELNERIASLEQILNYEEKLLDAKLRQQPSLAVAPIIDTQPLLKEPLLPAAATADTSISARETIVRDSAARSSRYAQEKLRQRSRIKRENA
jgi:hypothetical protein